VIEVKKILVRKEEMNLDIRSWEDVDKALLDIAESEITLNDIEGQLNIHINAAKERATQLSTPLKTRIKALSEVVEDWVERNRKDIDGKTKVLTYGKVGYRASSRVSVPTKTIDEVLEALRKHGMNDCISVKETVDKDMLGKYPDKDIEKVGCSKKYEDKFFMETDKKKIRA